MKILVSYFSASGLTKDLAIEISNFLHADLEEIIPIQKYSSKDLDWRNKHSRSSIEMKDESSRPEIKKTNSRIIKLRFNICRLSYLVVCRA